MNATKTKNRYTVEEIETWIENNPGGNGWLLAILRDPERGIDVETNKNAAITGGVSRPVHGIVGGTNQEG